GEVKGQGRMHRSASALRYSVMISTPGQVMSNAAVSNHHPFGLTGGARSIENIGKILRLHQTKRRGLPWLISDLHPAFIQRDQAAGYGHMSRGARIAQENLNAGMFQN